MMKKTMILAAFAALVSLASCQKEDIIDNGTDTNASPVFTASIAGATKTTVDLTDGKVTWEATDEITVTDGASASAVYAIESIDATTGKATFAIKSGETALGDGPYTATYGTEPATAQTYSATAGSLYMTAPATTENSFEFTVQCGLMKLNLTKAGVSVKSIAVTGTPTGGSETTYTLTCTEAQSITTAKDFFIALPAGSYTKIVITNASGDKCTLNSASGVAVAANHIKPVTFGESKINFTSGTATATIGGSNVDVKWIQLWKDGPKFAEYNVGATSATEYGGYYTWGGTYKNGKGIEWTADQNTGSSILSGDTDTATKLWGSNWRMPTKDELGKYEGEDYFMDPLCGGLLYECTCTWVNNYNGTGVNGLLCTGKGDYSSNSIFLPAAGFSEISAGVGEVWDLGGQCDYWTSMPDSYYDCAYYMRFFSNSKMYVSKDGYRYQGYSVRAVLAE